MRSTTIATIACAALIACDKHTHPGNAQFAHSQVSTAPAAGEDAMAVRVANDQLFDAIRKLDQENQGARGIATAREFGGRLYAITVGVDVSHCRDDYRAQFHKVVGAVAAVNHALVSMPPDDSEALSDLFGRSMRTDRVAQGNSAESALRNAVQDMISQMQELNTVAGRYGAASHM